ncbi:flexible cuticle protein 12-like [Aphis craccivora]|uniref:Flexible cuticle protein 12-like n=1 Tax=Aphis craccivora TaxID=307492 RepID=A0A6G0YJ59_APHCR|nr:flexible cuticle protein 12-like [Aphis craccivora]
MNTITVVVLAVFVFLQWSTAAVIPTYPTYPTEKPKTPVIGQLLRNDYVYDNNGQFSLNYQVDDGTSQTREGTLVLNDEGDDYVLIQKGSYSYISPEGIKVTVTYTADKEGFKIVESSNDVPARV